MKVLSILEKEMSQILALQTKLMDWQIMNMNSVTYYNASTSSIKFEMEINAEKTKLMTNNPDGIQKSKEINGKYL